MNGATVSNLQSRKKYSRTVDRKQLVANLGGDLSPAAQRHVFVRNEENRDAEIYENGLHVTGK